MFNINGFEIPLADAVIFFFSRINMKEIVVKDDVVFLNCDIGIATGEDLNSCCHKRY